MGEERATRSYHSPRREAGAALTRARILAAARELFWSRGYPGTSVKQIAERAGVSVDTLYAAVGRKPVLAQLVIEDELRAAGPGSAENRSALERMGRASRAATMLAVYAESLGRVQPRLAPLMEALKEAGHKDPNCRRIGESLAERRARNMLLLAADLRDTGDLRADLDDRTVADLIWATNAPEYFLLLASRGWSAERYSAHLRELWWRTLLRPAAQPPVPEMAPSASAEQT